MENLRRAVVEWRRRVVNILSAVLPINQNESCFSATNSEPQKGAEANGGGAKGVPQIAPVECGTTSRIRKQQLAQKTEAESNRKWVRVFSCGRGHSPIFAAAAECFGNGRCKHIKKM